MSVELADVYREQVTPIWRYVRLRVPSDADAEDVTMEVFERAIRSWGRYDGARGSVRAWLFGIARHTVVDHWRKQGRELPTAGPAEDRQEVDDDPESAALRRDGADQLRRHLGILTTREREAVALRFGSEMTSVEIGAAMGISATAARMLVHRGVSRLREVLHDG